MIRDLKLNLGFTLIELMVVMVIIAILTGLSLFALSGARASGRDARRKADLEHIASGIEIYKADCRYYPNASSIVAGSQLTGVAPCSPTNLNVYIQSVPDDSDSTLNYIYAPFGGTCPGGCTSFCLWTRLEDPPATTPSYCTSAGTCGSPPSCGSAACNFCIINP